MAFATLFQLDQSFADVALTQQESESTEFDYRPNKPFLLERYQLAPTATRDLHEALNPTLGFEPVDFNFDTVANQTDLDEAYENLDLLEKAVFDRALALDHCRRAAEILINQSTWKDSSAFFALFSTGQLRGFLSETSGKKAFELSDCLRREEAELLGYFLRSTGFSAPISDSLSVMEPPPNTIIGQQIGNVRSGFSAFAESLAPIEAIRIAEAISLHGFLDMSDMAAFALLEHAYLASNRVWSRLPTKARNLHRLLASSLGANDVLTARQLVATGLVSMLGFQSEEEVLGQLRERLGLR